MIKFELGVRGLFAALALFCLCPSAMAQDADADSAIADPTDAEPGICADASVLDEVFIETLAVDAAAITAWEPADDGGYTLQRHVYTCPCDNGGGCGLIVRGRREVDCVSMTCDGCSLHRDGLPVPSSDTRVASGGCGGPAPSDDQWATANARAAEIEGRIADGELLLPEYDADGNAIAPDGYTLVLEQVEGINLVYATPAEGDGDAEARLFKPRVDCFCSDEAGGGCAFDGVFCMPNGCNVCAVEIKPWWHFW